MQSLRDLVTAQILNHLNTKTGRAGLEKRQAFRAAIHDSDDYNTMINILTQGVKHKRNNGIIHEKSLRPIKKKKRFRNEASTKHNYIIGMANKTLYNSSMPRGNVKEKSVAKAIAEANYRQHGGYKKIKTTNDQHFVYVPNTYIVRNNGTIERNISAYWLTTTAEALRHHNHASISKPPPRRAAFLI